MEDALKPDTKKERPLVAATMFGVTTSCVNYAKDYLESKGYEVLVFHATGTGGKTMESLINAGFFKGVLDITTTEWCDELVGGVLAAGPNRCEAAGKNKVPQVVSVGALDMVNFGPIDTIPEKFSDRKFYKHNPTVTLMRTTTEELINIGNKIAEKLNMTSEKTALFLPLKGVSGIDAIGQPFFGPEEDNALFKTLRAEVNQDIVEIVEMSHHINEQIFAEAGADCLVAHMGLTTKGSIGAETALTLDDCCEKIRGIIKAGREVNPDIMVICHGGPIADPEDVAYVIKQVPEIDGFFGASSIERLASERGMTAQAAAFKSITK